LPSNDFQDGDCLIAGTLAGMLLYIYTPAQHLSPALLFTPDFLPSHNTAKDEG
jgi:hypothetical protein